jgi:hypothetical protein
MIPLVATISSIDLQPQSLATAHINLDFPGGITAALNGAFPSLAPLAIAAINQHSKDNASSGSGFIIHRDQGLKSPIGFCELILKRGITMHSQPFTDGPTTITQCPTTHTAIGTILPRLCEKGCVVEGSWLDIREINNAG